MHVCLPARTHTHIIRNYICVCSCVGVQMWRVRVRIYIYCVVNHCRNMILGSTCACSGAEDCPTVLQQVADVCPLSEGHTLFTSSGVQRQRLSVGKCTHASAHTHTHTHCVVGQCRNMVLRIMHHASGLSSACKEASMHAQTACYIPLPVMTVLSWSMPHTQWALCTGTEHVVG